MRPESGGSVRSVVGVKSDDRMISERKGKSSARELRGRRKMSCMHPESAA